MRFGDLLHLATESLVRARLRSVMMLIAMSIGVAAVVVLTSLGEGARRYVTGEFQALGTDLLIVLPGRSETTGVQPGLFAGETPRDLTLGDAQALLRIPDVERIAPLVVGSAPVSAGELSREVPVIGTNADFLTVRKLAMGQGRFLPPGELDRSLAVCIIGTKVRSELFAHRPAVGESVRIGDRRFRVIGVLARLGPGRRLRHPGARHHPGEQRPAAVQHRVAVPHPDPGARPGLDGAGARAGARDDRRAAPGRGRRDRHHAGRRARHVRPDLHGADADARRHRLDQPRGRRHPDHERDAGRGEPAHRGDRPAEGARRPRAADHGAVPRRGHPAVDAPARLRASASATPPAGSSGASIPRCRWARRRGRSSSRSSSPSRAGSSSGCCRRGARRASTR